MNSKPDNTFGRPATAEILCHRCGVPMVPGKALVPSFCISTDFPGDRDSEGATRSEGFSDGTPADCWKCPQCGHSVQAVTPA